MVKENIKKYPNKLDNLNEKWDEIQNEIIYLSNQGLTKEIKVEIRSLNGKLNTVTNNIMKEIEVD